MELPREQIAQVLINFNVNCCARTAFCSRDKITQMCNAKDAPVGLVRTAFRAPASSPSTQALPLHQGMFEHMWKRDGTSHMTWAHEDMSAMAMRQCVRATCRCTKIHEHSTQHIAHECTSASVHKLTLHPLSFENAVSDCKRVACRSYYMLLKMMAYYKRMSHLPMLLLKLLPETLHFARIHLCHDCCKVAGRAATSSHAQEHRDVLRRRSCELA